MNSVIFDQLLGSLFSRSVICFLIVTAMTKRWYSDEKAIQNKKAPCKSTGLSNLIRQRPTLPRIITRSTMGAEGLCHYIGEGLHPPLERGVNPTLSPHSKFCWRKIFQLSPQPS